MHAEIIAIGSELTCGSRLDTNSQWLSRELESLGWTVIRHTTLSDDRTAIVEEFRAASRRARVVLVTGGLGPTLDDITREALAEAFQQPLIRDPESVRQIEALFAARGRTMPERNYRQADRPENSQALPNSCGTAPGVLLRVTQGSDESCLIAAMPGVPAEMKPMFEQQVRPLLPDSGIVMCRRVVRTFGYGESEAERLLGDLTARGRNPEVGITASEAVISLWVTARSGSSDESQRMAGDTVNLIKVRLGEAVYAEDDSELHDVLISRLARCRHQLFLAEGSTTGGLIAQWLTETPEGESVVAFGQILPQHPSARALDSSWTETAKSLAADIRQRHGTPYIILSSPAEDHVTESGVSVRRGWIAVATPTDWQVVDVSMTGNLAIFRQRAARTALNRLRLQLLHDEHSSV